jgi:Contractile injection system tube protein
VERVAFLIEETGERLGCLLNPESVVVRRQAGLRWRTSAVGRLTGPGLADDALLYTGGGRTELDLDLLFDVSLAGSSIRSEDVRDLTGPLWQLAESSQDPDGRGRPPLVRFVWGKAWNVPGLIAAVAERLERFSPGGVPSRSWLRLRLLRVAAPPSEDPLAGDPPRSAAVLAPEIPGAVGEARFHRLVGDGDGGGESLDQLAQRYYGHPAFWRLLARANARIEDPLDPPANLLLRIPSAPEVGR